MNICALCSRYHVGTADIPEFGGRQPVLTVHCSTFGAKPPWHSCGLFRPRPEPKPEPPPPPPDMFDRVLAKIEKETTK